MTGVFILPSFLIVKAVCPSRKHLLCARVSGPLAVQIQLPLHEPYTVLLLNLFRDQHRKNTGRLRSAPPKLVGKLRLRLNTLAPGLQYESDLPLLADRKEGGTHKATLSVVAKVSNVGSAEDYEQDILITFKNLTSLEPLKFCHVSHISLAFYMRSSVHNCIVLMLGFNKLHSRLSFGKVAQVSALR